MTKGEAIFCLRQYRRDVCARHSCRSFSCQQNRFRRCCYRDYLIDNLIREIRYSESDPIMTVLGFISWIEYILENAEMDHTETLGFARIMDEEACHIEKLLREKEKERNESNQLEAVRQ